MWVKKQQLKQDMKQETGSKLGKGYVKPVYCYPAYLTYMQSTSREMLGWRSHKLEIKTARRGKKTKKKIAERNINNLRYVDNITLMAESEEELKSLLMRVKEKNEKVG